VSLRHCILGLLNLRPLSGYDLKKSFDGSVNHFWRADQSQIYRTLDRLVADGRVEVTVQPQEGRPDRKEHRITPSGQQELAHWLRSPLTAEVTREPFLARLFFLGDLGDEHAVGDLLRERREQVRQARDRLLQVGEASPEPTDLAGRLRMATLHYGLEHAEAELQWLDAQPWSARATAAGPVEVG
jgi:DNA-binding PadR family transcriptional regulator